jgi:hypothetical protein
MKNKKTLNIDEVLNSIEPINKAQAPNFFYSKLRLKMENRVSASNNYWYNTNPIALIACFCVLICFNVLMFKKEGLHSNDPKITNVNLQHNDYYLNTELVYE